MIEKPFASSRASKHTNGQGLENQAPIFADLFVNCKLLSQSDGATFLGLIPRLGFNLISTWLQPGGTGSHQMLSKPFSTVFLEKPLKTAERISG
jgi:hypothetical protein